MKPSNKLSMNSILEARASNTLQDTIVPDPRPNRGSVTTAQQAIAGLERLGLKGMLERTGSPNWTRVYIYDWNYGRDRQIRETGSDKNYMGLYVGRLSFEYDVLKSIKLHIHPGYQARSIHLMLKKRLILDHINYYTLGVKAYNLEFEHVDKAKKLMRDSKTKKTGKRKLNGALERIDNHLRRFFNEVYNVQV